MNRYHHKLDEEVWRLLRLTSRTFYLSIRQLPGLAGDALCLAYLMLRVSDYLEDNRVMTGDEKFTALNLWHQVITGKAQNQDVLALLPLEDPSENRDLAAARAIPLILDDLARVPPALQQGIIHHVGDSTLGMARWVKRGPDFRDENDLDDYMHEVAGRVGYLSTEIFAWQYPAIQSRLPSLMAVARETGLALQTVNIIRGLHSDYERGWIYVPSSFCAAYNITPNNLFEPACQPQAMLVVDLMVQKAQKHLGKALEYVRILPPWLHRLRLACIWPLLFATRTLAVSHRNLAVLLGEVKITRGEVKRIILDSTVLGWSNIWLDNYIQKLQKQPQA
jgi:farnesyl-diphosphate farnesyltransferase